MLQITQNLKTGIIELSEVPFPTLTPDSILVRNHYSLISAGTESQKVSVGQKSYIGKAKEKPEQVKQVIDSIKKEGLSSTYRKVMNKLDSLSPLGYSSAGVVIEVGRNIKKFNIGDRVSCAGQDIANHAEVISVPENLAVHIPDNVEYQYASFSTLGAIAMQGVRQAELSLGESCAVIGLGLIGQITIQLLNAAGIDAYGIDFDQRLVDLAASAGARHSYNRNDEKLEKSLIDFSGGYGVDAVIITAATSSLDPVELAGRLCRQKGKVVVVGAVSTGFSRENYYKKELELRMSSSYGPGRYNRNYEEKGYDFPIGYVRWTENRNMQSFLNLVSLNKISIGKLISHVFPFNEALKAYDLITERKEPFTGILLEYNTTKSVDKNVILNQNAFSSRDVNISFIGAGNFAQNSLLPYLKNTNLVSVSTATSHNSKNVASKHGFSRAVSDSDQVISETDSNTIFVATRHNLHAEMVLKILNAGKNVFVEKPLCMTEEELDSITEAYAGSGKHLMVGFNRRFAKHISRIKTQLNDDMPVAVNYRINAGFIPHDHWIQDPETGGGRIIGEVCHFVDLVMFLSNSAPDKLYASAMPDNLGLNDTLSVTINFKNGSIASVCYFSGGSKELKKELLEVHQNGVSFVLDDFKKLTVYGKRVNEFKSIGQDKGHETEVLSFINSIKEGKETPVSFNEIYLSTKMTFDIIKSIRTNSVIKY